MKAILVIDKMPNSCDKCEVRCTEYTGKDYAQKGIKRPTWCPLKPLPEKNTWDITKNGHVTEYAEGWNACLDEILGETE